MMLDVTQKHIDPTLCRSCKKPHGLTEIDAGTDQEWLRLCTPCFNDIKPHRFRIPGLVKP